MKDIQFQFEQFHAENPLILTTLEELADRWLRVRQVVGMKMLWEVLRWNVGIRTNGDPYKLNNNFTSRYAREILRRHPEWDGRIKTRALAA